MEEQLSGTENRDKRKRELLNILNAFDKSIKSDYPDSQ